MGARGLFSTSLVDIAEEADEINNKANSDTKVDTLVTKTIEDKPSYQVERSKAGRFQCCKEFGKEIRNRSIIDKYSKKGCIKMQPFCISEFFKQKLLFDSEYAPEQTAPQTVRFHYHNFHRFLILSKGLCARLPYG